MFKSTSHCRNHRTLRARPQHREAEKGGKRRCHDTAGLYIVHVTGLREHARKDGLCAGEEAAETLARKTKASKKTILSCCRVEEFEVTVRALCCRNLEG
jgi:hypothetical protein